MMATYGQHDMVHSQVPRVPLPIDFSEDEPIYVNAKQYHAIPRRRQLRAKLVAQNRIAKGRKPYLHECRHLHARKRARGSGGRFLNTKKQEEQQEQQQSNGNAANGKKAAGASLLQLGGGYFCDPNAPHSETMNIRSSGSTPSEITGLSNGDVFLLQDTLRYSCDYHSHLGGAKHGGGSVVHPEPQQQISVFR